MIVEKEHDIDAGRVQRVGIVSKKHERGEAGGTNGVALGNSLGRVANSIKLVRYLANFGRQFGHLGDTAGVIGDWAECIESNNNAGHRQHRCCGDRNVVKASKIITRRCQCKCAPDAGTNGQDRQSRRLHGGAESRDNIRRVAG